MLTWDPTSSKFVGVAPDGSRRVRYRQPRVMIIMFKHWKSLPVIFSVNPFTADPVKALHFARLV